MPKRKKKNPETIGDLIDEIKSANQTINEEIESANQTINEENNTKTEQEDYEKRNVLLRLAEDGELDKSVAYIKKASQKVIDKLHSEYERKRMQKANKFLTDLLISKFSSTLGGLDAIDDPEELCKELKKDELLKRDVYSIVETISPYIPLLGFLTGSITTARHVYKHKYEPKEEVNE